MPAPFASPHLKAMMPLSCQETNFGHLYNDGALQLSVFMVPGLGLLLGRTMQPTFEVADSPGGEPIVNQDALLRRLPLVSALEDIADAPFVEFIKHLTYDDYYRSYGIKEKYAEIQAPAYLITGWFDNLVHEQFRIFRGMRTQGGSPEARLGTRILVDPWSHGSLGTKPTAWTAPFSENAAVDLRAEMLRWFGHWLKRQENGIDSEPPIRIYVMGANSWRSENEWPLSRTEFTKFHLLSGGKANSLGGDGRLSGSTTKTGAVTDSFVYDPEDPVPTHGGAISTVRSLQGPLDRSAVQRRSDILVYTTDPLTEDMEVTGPVDVQLYAASSVTDTDFTAALSDVYPNGQALLICEGIRVARFRDSLENPSPIEPGKVYAYNISLWETSNLFKRGHRIRLEISSSNFPRYARNQNTGEPLGMSARVERAKQTVYHDALHPSHIVLPVIHEVQKRQ